MLRRDADDSGQPVIIIQSHDPHPLRITADRADVRRFDPLDLSKAAHHHDFIIVLDAYNSHDLAISLTGANATDSLATPFLRSVTGRGTGVVGRKTIRMRAKQRAFAIAVFADSQQGCFRIGNHHTDQHVIACQADSLDPRCISTHRPGIRFTEADCHPVGRGDHDLIT